MREYNICYSTDSNYAELLAVSITSLLVNSANDESFNIYVLDGGLTKSDKQNIEILNNIKKFNIQYIKMDEKEFKDCPLFLKPKDDKHIAYHVTIPTYFKLKLSEVLPNLKKVLYLDCDVIINDSVEALYNIDMKGFANAMALDAESKSEAKRLKTKQYYNAGVMLVDLEFWRKNKITEKLFNFVKTNKKDILWVDQDIFNSVLQKQIKEINNIWNFQYFQYEEIDKTALTNCRIFHLAGRFKPWMIPFEHPLYELYYHYLALTPWRNKILGYKINGAGKHLKDNIGGKITNIILSAYNKDISKLYDELSKNYEYTNDRDAAAKFEVSQAVDKIYNSIEEKSGVIDAVTDEKISKVYEEITKNYEYTNEKNEKIKKEILKEVENILKNSQVDTSGIVSQTDEKISKVYEEITKNYEYTNEKDESVKYEISQNIDKLLKDIEGNNNFIQSQTDEKISKVYDEITKNYEYTNEKNDETLKAVDKKAIELNSQTDEKFSKVYDEITKNYEYTNEKNNETLKAVDEKAIELNSQTDEKISKVYEEITKNYEYTNEKNESVRYEISQNIDKLLKDIEKNSNFIQTQTDEKISKINDEITKNYEFTNQLNNQTNVRLDGFVSDITAKYTSANEIIRSENIKNNEKINKEIKAQTEEISTKLERKLEKLSEKFDKNNEVLKANNKNLKTEIETKIKNNLTETDNKIKLISDKTNENISKIKDEFKLKLAADIDIINKNTIKNFELSNVQTDEKINKVYDEITRNYEFTKQLNNEVKEDINKSEQTIETILNELQNNKQSIEFSSNDLQERIDNLNNQTNQNINKVYEEITRNYEFTKAQDIELHTKLDNFSETLNKKQQEFDAKQQEYAEKLNSVEIKTDERIQVLSSNTDNRIEQILEEIQNNDKKYLEQTTEFKIDVYKDIDNINNQIRETDSASKNAIENIETLISKNYDELNLLNNDLKSELKNDIMVESQSLEAKIGSQFDTINHSIENIYLTIGDTSNQLERAFDELAKNYDFANKLNDDLTLRINQEKETTENAIAALDENCKKIKDEQNLFENIIDGRIETLISQNEEKINSVYEEITKNKDYSQYLISESEARNKQELEKSVCEINGTIASLKTETDEKIEQKGKDLYWHTDSNIEKLEQRINEKFDNYTSEQKKAQETKYNELYYTINEQASDLYREIKDTSLAIENTFNNKVDDLYRNNDNINNEINNIKYSLNTKLDEEAVNHLISKLEQSLKDNEAEHKNNIEKIKAEMDDKLNQQRVKYENKIVNLEMRIEQLYSSIQYLKKNPIQKMLYRMKNKSEESK